MFEIAAGSWVINLYFTDGNQLMEKAEDLNVRKKSDLFEKRVFENTLNTGSNKKHIFEYKMF